MEERSGREAAQGIVQEIGKRLRRAREGKGLTLSQVEEALKIRKKYLEALEQGRLDELPAPVFAKGFLRSYANHLGLDGEEMLQELRDWMKAEGKSEEPPVLQLQPSPLMGMEENAGFGDDLPRRRDRRAASRPPGPAVSRRKIRRIGTAVVGGVLVALGLFALLVWILIQQAIPKPSAVSKGKPPAPATVTRRVYRRARAPRLSAPHLTVTALPGASATQASYRVQGVPNLALTVANTGTLIGWVGQRVGGVYANQVMLAPGQRYVFRAGNSLVVTFGKAYESKLWINGKALGMAGGTQVRTIRFQRA